MAGALVPPPGLGLFTVTSTVPAAPRSLLAMVAVSCEELTHVVARGLPFHSTVLADCVQLGVLLELPVPPLPPLPLPPELLELENWAQVNPVPLTVSVNPPLLARAVFGASEVSTGGGLLMENGSVFDRPPPGSGFSTAICATPGVWRSSLPMVAVSCVELT